MPKINPVDMVRRDKPKYKGIGRLVDIAEGAKDSFTVGTAIVDGVMLWTYTMMAKRDLDGLREP
jgi:hypothetical protein